MSKDCIQRWRENHPDKNAEYTAKWYESNKDKKREYNREYRKRRAALIKAHYTARRAKCRLTALSDDEKDAIKRIYDLCPDGYEVDHLIPLSKGGPHRVWNFRYITKRHNRTKYNRMPSKRTLFAHICNQLANISKALEDNKHV